MKRKIFCVLIASLTFECVVTAVSSFFFAKVKLYFQILNMLFLIVIPSF